MISTQDMAIEPDLCWRSQIILMQLTLNTEYVQY